MNDRVALVSIKRYMPYHMGTQHGIYPDSERLYAGYIAVFSRGRNRSRDLAEWGRTPMQAYKHGLTACRKKNS